MDILTEPAALEIARRYWGVDGVISPLPSYADQNYRIRNEHGDYVLKVAHPSWERSDLDLENCAMMALAANEPALRWPRVQIAVDGSHLLMLPIGGQPCPVRMLSFVPGKTYAQVIGNVSTSQRVRLHGSLGAAVGRLTRGLQNFRHPAAQRRHDWNLMRMPQLANDVELIDDAPLRLVVKSQLQEFTAQLPRWHHELPITVVHNDANDQNVIVSADGNGSPSVSAFIDFGDMCTSFRVVELAIACSYAMQHADDPVLCAQDIVREYMAQSVLRRAELENLHIFIIARLSQSVLMATRAHRKNPDNHYVLTSQQGSRALLHTLADTAHDAIVGPLLESCHE